MANTHGTLLVKVHKDAEAVVALLILPVSDVEHGGDEPALVSDVQATVPYKTQKKTMPVCIDIVITRNHWEP